MRKKSFLVIILLHIVHLSLICGNEIIDNNIAIINKYYSNLAAVIIDPTQKDENKLFEYKKLTNLSTAYKISTQKVSFDTFCSWYRNTCDFKIFQMEKNGKSLYHFIILLQENTDKKYVYNYDLFDVIMKIDQNVIQESTSKRLKRLVQQTVSNIDNRTIQVILDAEKNQYELHVWNEQNDILIWEVKIKSISYIPTFNKFQQLDQLLLINYSEYEFWTDIIVDLKTLAVKKLKLPDVLISSDKRFIINYSRQSGYTENPFGLSLEFADNQYIGRDLMEGKCYIENLNYLIKNNQSFLSFKAIPKGDYKFLSVEKGFTTDNNSNNETDNIMINLTEILKNI